jgi:hypothetical protein
MDRIVYYWRRFVHRLVMITGVDLRRNLPRGSVTYGPRRTRGEP